MVEKKKGFVLYFDMYPSISRLPAQQRGELLLAMCEYAMAEAEQTVSLDDILRNHPEMTQDTCMAFSFIAQTICRDTEKWKEKSLRYQQAAQRRKTEKQSNASEGMSQYVKSLRPDMFDCNPDESL
jgi:uncharacterized protein YdaU (DUF1376 family)